MRMPPSGASRGVSDHLANIKGNNIDKNSEELCIDTAESEHTE